MKNIINTYIVFINRKYPFDDEYVKLHQLTNGDFIKEDWKGKLEKFDTQEALKLIGKTK